MSGDPLRAGDTTADDYADVACSRKQSHKSQEKEFRGRIAVLSSGRTRRSLKAEGHRGSANRQGN